MVGDLGRRFCDGTDNAHGSADFHRGLSCICACFDLFEQNDSIRLAQVRSCVDLWRLDLWNFLVLLRLITRSRECNC